MKSKMLPIAGDASFRTFYRSINKKKNKIVVLAKREKYQNLIAYSTINKFLNTNKIYAPKLYAHDFNKGSIVIEDFGDISFYKILIKKKNKLAIYKELVDLLIKIQKIKPKSKIKNINGTVHTLRKYDNRHLLKESELFFNWYLPLFLNKKKALNIKIKSKKILLKIFSQLNFPNSCFVHKDYHSQNLIKIKKKIGIIDSQDALIGNLAYDLVSLIDDVRIKTPAKLKNQIYSYYLEKNKKNLKSNTNIFFKDFNTLSVQRSLKIIGIFSRLFKRDGKNRYLKFIPYAWKILELRMNGKIFSELKKILDQNIPQNIRKKIIKK